MGVVEHGHLLISIDKNHELSDAGIAKNGTASVSFVLPFWVSFRGGVSQKPESRDFLFDLSLFITS